MTEAQAKTEVRVDSDAPTIGPSSSSPPSSSSSSSSSSSPLDTSADATDPRIGMLLKDSYRIERRLGSGGMGAVYLAEHEAIKKKVAIKILDVEAGQRADLKERFLREARAAAAIPDEHVIAIHDFGDTPDGSVFFVMEYLQGVDLSNVLAREAPLPWPRARDLMLQICRALQAAHDRGIVHRDMKPANIFRLDRNDRDVIKVLDFGIAKSLNPDANLGGVALTRTGMLFGTPEYMSPEQAQGDRLDHRVDIYAAGVILFEMLTGKLPFRAETFMALLNRHMFEAPPRPADVAPNANIPAAAEGVVLKALQKNPDLRFQSMSEMADALIAVDAGITPVVVAESLRSPSSASAMSFRTQEGRIDRRRLWAIAAGIGGVVVTAGVLLLSSGPAPEPEQPLPPPVVAPPPPEPAPEPVPEVVKLPPPTSVVITLHIDTGKVNANIYDEENAFLGTTANPEGISLERGDIARQLELRATNYESLRIKVFPNRDVLRMTAPMTAIRRARPEPKPEPTPGTVDTTATPTTDPATPPDPPPDTKTPPDTKVDSKTPTKPPDPPPLPPDIKPGPETPKPKKIGP